MERYNRIKIKEGRAFYHYMTRTENGARLFDDQAKAVLRKQLWAAADFNGVELLRCRVRSLTDGAVLGSAASVQCFC